MIEKIKSPVDLKRLKLHELNQLASEIRSFLIDKVSKTGGHLSPNLGVVELTIAIHYVFDIPVDDLIFDVGHQSYVHKILTGRADKFDYLRKKDGISGYPVPSESNYDICIAGHSSTSISIACGIAAAKKRNNDNSSTIALIGDGSFTGGMAFEAINNISSENLPVIIILNDNGMSISKNIGGISLYLKKLTSSREYIKLKRIILSLENIKPIGRIIISVLYRIKEYFKSILMPSRNFFEDMGLTYYGPIDGHNIEKLISIFQEIRLLRKPVILHVKTIKGKGHDLSEKEPDKYHGISGTSIGKEDTIPLKESGKSYSELFGECLVKLAEKDEKICAITAAMQIGTGLKTFAEKFKDRFFDVGIAEQHAVDFALGLSLKGFKPYVAIYSTFLQRAYDQLLIDIGIMKAKVVFCIDRAGFVSGDGETHQGIFDISYLRTIPNMTIMSPCCGKEFVFMLNWINDNLNAPIAIRYPKDIVDDFNLELEKIEMGKSSIIKKGDGVKIIFFGPLLRYIYEATDKLNKKNIFPEIINLRFAKPLDYELIDRVVKDNKNVLIIEEGIYSGGVSMYLSNEIMKKNKNIKIITINAGDSYPFVAERYQLLDYFGFLSDNIYNKVWELSI